MSQQAGTTRTHCDDLESMLREIGMVLMSCDTEGTLAASRKSNRRDWLTELIRTPGIVRRGLLAACEQWAAADGAPAAAKAANWNCKSDVTSAAWARTRAAAASWAGAPG